MCRVKTVLRRKIMTKLIKSNQGHPSVSFNIISFLVEKLKIFNFFYRECGSVNLKYCWDNGNLCVSKCIRSQIWECQNVRRDTLITLPKFMRTYHTNPGPEKLGARSCHAPTMHLNYNRGERNNVYIKYVYLHIYFFKINLDLRQ